MIPTFFILTSTFILLLLSPYNSTIKEKEVRNNTSISIDLNFRSKIENKGLISDKKITRPQNKNKTGIEIPSERYSESPLVMEEWMISPKNWINNSVKKSQ